LKGGREKGKEGRGAAARVDELGDKENKGGQKNRLVREITRIWKKKHMG